MVILQQSDAVGQLVEGAMASAGAVTGTTKAISGLGTSFLTADPTMGHLAATGTTELAKTTVIALALYVDPLDIKPNSIPRAISPKIPCFYSGIMCF